MKLPKTGRLDGLASEGGEMKKDTLVDCPAPIVIVGVGKVAVP